MAIGEKKALKVFLCHASGDKPQVRALYKRLVAEGVDAWLDQEKLLPGQDWRVEIPRAVQEADVVVICLSNKSITKEGYIQKEIKFALDSADEKPDGTIFLIPARIEDCPVPEKLSRWHWVDLFEEDGYVKLLRSLKLRADKVGAAITPSAYEDEDAETERRLDQYYTEGLAAFYTEDWDKACRRFQLILSERPNHKNAIEKLEEAEKRRDLSKLYTQSMDAYQAEDWQTAIKTLDELLKKSPEYKDSTQLLKNAKKQNQLNDLYIEAKKLHTAGKWQAVLKVFDQIFVIEPNHPDPDRLLPSAREEVVKLNRLAELNDLYSRAVREMDLGNWHEARKLLEQVHKAQTGFLETERLLRKVEDELLKIEEANKRNDQINTLYEQAHGLIRSKNWRKALDKVEEIQKLDSQFEDKDGIAEKAKAFLEREDLEAQKQNQVAAMYADAVRLVKEGKHPEALEKWNQVRTIDPKYPDRQWVQRAMRKKSAELMKSGAQPDKNEFVFASAGTTDQAWLLLAAFLATMIVRAIWGAIEDSFHIWDTDAPLLPQFLTLFGIGGSYGVIVAFSLRRTVHNWGLSQSLIVIIGWGIGLCTGLQFINMGWEFMTAVLILCSLSVAVAIKWANPTTTLTKIVLIIVCWALAWKAGGILGEQLGNIIDAKFVWLAADSITILFGLTATFAVYENNSSRLVQLVGLSILGLAAGNYIATTLSEAVSSDSPLLTPLLLALWGFIGGVIFELPSRDLGKILAKGALCGIGFVIGYVAALLILPASMQELYPERHAIFRNSIWGAGLGIFFGLGIRRISTIGLLTVLGSAIFVFTSVYSSILSMGSLSEASLRGALIGLILGLGYVYVTRETNGHSEAVEP